MTPTIVHWLGFGAFVSVLLLLDLVVFHRDTKDPTFRDSAKWTLIWCGLALAFNGLVGYMFGSQAAMEFLTGYLVEWSLSVDNVFVIAVIFSFFGVPLKYQYRVLFWGILGAVVMRLTFVLAGTALIRQFEWVTFIFGGFLVYTGIKLAIHSDEEPEPEKNILFRLAKKVFRIAHQPHGEKFFAVENGRLCITPLFLVLLVVESTDLLFAVDSVPAIISIVDKNAAYFTFVVFTSNVFAVLGLRALYFLLAGMMDVFCYLHYGLSAVLTFVGLKMIVEYQFEFHFFKKYSWASFVVIVGLLGLSIGASLLADRRRKHLVGPFPEFADSEKEDENDDSV